MRPVGMDGADGHRPNEEDNVGAAFGRLYLMGGV